MIKTHENRDWLQEQYIAQKESSYAMAKEAGCSPATILRRLRKFDIPIRGHNALCCAQDWLYKQYIVRGKSTYAMAKEAKCDPKTIYRWLYRYGIPVRSRAEGIFFALRNSVIITPGLLEFMRGEIIGDGCVRMPGNRSALYSHGSKYQQYVAWLSGLFAEWGIEQVGQITDHKDKKTGVIYYKYASKSYPELVPIYKRWYPNGKKIVPKDLELTPIMARQWYLGDGHLAHDKRGARPSIKFGTYAFDQQSIAHLLEELSKHGFTATRHADNTIYLWVRSVQEFLNWIGPCPIPCYDYKWEY